MVEIAALLVILFIAPTVIFWVGVIIIGVIAIFWELVCK